MAKPAFIVHGASPQGMTGCRFDEETYEWIPEDRKFICILHNHQQSQDGRPPYASLLAMVLDDDYSRKMAEHLCKLLNDNPLPQ